MPAQGEWPKTPNVQKRSMMLSKLNRDKTPLHSSILLLFCSVHEEIAKLFVLVLDRSISLAVVAGQPLLINDTNSMRGTLTIGT